MRGVGRIARRSTPRATRDRSPAGEIAGDRGETRTSGTPARSRRDAEIVEIGTRPREIAARSRRDRARSAHARRCCQTTSALRPACARTTLAAPPAARGTHRRGERKPSGTMVPHPPAPRPAPLSHASLLLCLAPAPLSYAGPRARPATCLQQGAQAGLRRSGQPVAQVLVPARRKWQTGSCVQRPEPSDGPGRQRGRRPQAGRPRTAASTSGGLPLPKDLQVRSQHQRRALRRLCALLRTRAPSSRSCVRSTHATQRRSQTSRRFESRRDHAR